MTQDSVVRALRDERKRVAEKLEEINVQLFQLDKALDAFAVERTTPASLRDRWAAPAKAKKAPRISPQRNAAWKRKLSKKLKAYWANMTPEQRRAESERRLLKRQSR